MSVRVNRKHGAHTAVTERIGGVHAIGGEVLAKSYGQEPPHLGFLCSHDCLAEQVQMKQLPIIEQVSISSEPVNQRASIRTSICRDRPNRPEWAIGHLDALQESARVSVSD
jgi:hypothetical protein